jgi:hypothetical protein
MRLFRTLLLVLVVVAVGCGLSADDSGDTVPESPSVTADRGCAHVVSAEVTRSNGGYRVTATVRSADTGWDKYADAWEVRTLDGAVVGTRILDHPHETEQPFTRSLNGVAIPAGVTEVVVAARDSVVGFCGETVTVAVPS